VSDRKLALPLKSRPIYVDNLFKETAKIETGMAGKSSWDQANRRQKLGLVWRIRKKISQIIKDYFYLPFYLLIILWMYSTVHTTCNYSTLYMVYKNYMHATCSAT
jgi:hypothetical protein